MDNDADNLGLVVDVERFALHDGPGIRTTVFLKGCALRCLWCHNPETWHNVPELLIKYEKCDACLRGGVVCPFGVHLKGEQNSREITHDRSQTGSFNPSDCKLGAVRVVGQRRTVESIIDEVIEDMPFYLGSHGGMTVSGGEPMRQFDFTKRLLSAAKALGIHTCLDTCGYATMEQYRELIPYVDLFLYDYKATSPDHHRSLTGVTNELILQNLHQLLQNSNVNVILRCPLIPQVNDDDEHIRSIANLSRSYPNIVEVEVMAYHTFGRGKWRELGLTDPYQDKSSADLSQTAKWNEQLYALGARLKGHQGGA